MADNIINAQERIESLNAVLNQHVGVLDSVADKLIEVNTQYKIIPSEFLNAQKEILRLQAEQAKTNAALQRELQANQRTLQTESRTRQTLNREKQTEIRLQETQARQIARVNREREKEARTLARSAGLYNNIQKRVNILTKQYNDLAAKKALNNNLTAREEGFLKGLTTTLNRYQGALKGVDANIQKYGRNVGNYASGWSGLNNAVSQLTREAPAFAISLQTGFLALSNNIPILADEIERLIATNKQLLAQGKPTQSVFKQLAASVFSFQTILSAGVLLLTLYGEDIINLGKEIFGFTNVLNDAEKAQERLNKLNEEFGDTTKKVANEAAREASELLLLKREIEDTSVGIEKRNRAVDSLIKNYPEYFGNLERDKILTGDVADAYDRANDAIIKRAQLNVAQKKLEILVEENLTTILKAQADQQRISGLTAAEVSKQTGVSIELAKDLIDAQKRKNEADLQGNEVVNQQINTLLDFIKTLGATRKAVDDLSEKRSDIPKVANVLEEDFKRAEIAFKAFQKTNSDFNQFEVPTQDELTRGIEDLATKANASLDSIKNKTVDFGTVAKQVFADTFQTFGDFYNLDLQSFSNLFDNKVNTINDWANASKAAISGVLDASLQRYDVELQAAQTARDLIINNELSTEKERRIANERFEEEERRIKTKRARQERTNTLIKIAVDTAAAIAATLAPPPLGYGPLLGPATIPLIAGLGLAQAALVASQPLPRFAEGTKAPLTKDTFAVVGDGGRSEAITKNGKLLGITGDKPELAFLPQGSEVQKDAETYLMNSIFAMNMSAQGQMLSQVSLDSAMSQELAMLRKDTKNTWSEVKRLANRPIYNNVTIKSPWDYSQ